MNSMIIQPNNIFTKFLNWIKRVLGIKNKKLYKSASVTNNSFSENNEKTNNLEKNEDRYVYKQDLDFEAEKKYTIELLNGISKNKIKLDDLNLADIIRIKLLLKG